MSNSVERKDNDTEYNDAKLIITQENYSEHNSTELYDIKRYVSNIEHNDYLQNGVNPNGSENNDTHDIDTEQYDIKVNDTLDNYTIYLA